MRVLHVPEMTTTATAVIADEADCTPFLYSMQYTPLGVHHGSSAVFKRGLTDSTPLIRLIGAYPNGRNPLINKDLSAEEERGGFLPVKISADNDGGPISLSIS